MTPADHKTNQLCGKSKHSNARNSVVLDSQRSLVIYCEKSYCYKTILDQAFFTNGIYFGQNASSLSNPVQPNKGQLSSEDKKTQRGLHVFRYAPQNSIMSRCWSVMASLAVGHTRRKGNCLANH